MKEEVWLQKLKKRVEDYAEPSPAAGWERLEKELPAPKKARTAIPLRQWWAMGAAAMIIGAVSLIGLRLTDTTVTPDWQSSASPVLTVAGDTLYISMPAPTAQAVTSNRITARVVTRPHPVPTPTEATRPESFPAPSPVLMQQTAGKSEGMDTLAASSPASPNAPTSTTAPTTGLQSSPKEKQAPKAQRLPETDDLLALAEETPSQKKGWAISLSAGNTGGFSSQLNHSGMQNLAQSAPGTGFMGLDLTHASNGIIAIPEGQELVFKNGIPYLQQNKRQIVSADHKQPVSVGLAIRKDLPKNFSVETGLVYTLLISGLYYENSATKTRQKLHYLGIPLRANWNFVDKKDFTLYLSAGGMIEKCIYGKIGTETETVAPVQWSVMASVGAQYNMNRHVGIYVEPGVSYYFDDGSEVQTIRKDNPCNFTLQAGLRLSY